MSTNRLKFRAYSYTPSRGHFMVYSEDNLPGFFRDYEGDPIDQWTGLYDSEGVEIFEGDILRYPPKDSWDRENFAAHEVFYHDGDMAGGAGIGYRMCRIHYHGNLAGGYIPEFLPRNTEKMVVAGDIYQHPELLEQS